MKKLILLSFSIIFGVIVNAQIDVNKSEIDPVYLKFLPSDVNPENLRPSDIPSEQVLKQMGLSESEINEAMDYKYSRGKYSISPSDTAVSHFNLTTFYEAFGDTLRTDTITYPQAKIYGQDIFRNNNLSFYQKALDAKFLRIIK